MILQRIERLIAALEAMGAEGCMLHAPENMRYFSGYTGEGLIVLGRQGRTILTDSRYTEQAMRQAPDYQVVEYNAELPYDRPYGKRLRRWGCSALALRTHASPWLISSG